MTFRVDDLLVTLLPEHLAADKACPKCSKCSERSATPSPCTPDDPHTQNCGCIQSGSQQPKPTKKSETWRDEQFVLLSQALEEALSR
jgi:hypothetical protein